MLAIKAPDLPGYKLALLRTFNRLKGIIPQGNPKQRYRKAYEVFKQNAELQKTT
jgi:hypothetical protein